MDTDVKNAVAFSRHNLVRTTFLWPNGGISSQVIDLNDTDKRIQFATLAARCYSCNGVVICNGVNHNQAATEVSLVEVNGIIRELPKNYPITVAKGGTTWSKMD